MPNNPSTPAHPPKKVELSPEKDQLTLTYLDGSFLLTAEYLRVYSPSAEVRGHGVGNEVLQTGKKHVVILGIEPVGNYGLKFIFSDKHDSGIYHWGYLRELCVEQEEKWASYLTRLDAAGASR